MKALISSAPADRVAAQAAWFDGRLRDNHRAALAALCFGLAGLEGSTLALVLARCSPRQEAG